MCQWENIILCLGNGKKLGTENIRFIIHIVYIGRPLPNLGVV